MKLHASGEDYLEAILVLHKKMGMVRSVDSYSVLYHLMADQRIAVIAPTARQAGRPRSIPIQDCLI